MKRYCIPLKHLWEARVVVNACTLSSQCAPALGRLRWECCCAIRLDEARENSTYEPFSRKLAMPSLGKENFILLYPKRKINKKEIEHICWFQTEGFILNQSTCRYDNKFLFFFLNQSVCEFIAGFNSVWCLQALIWERVLLWGVHFAKVIKPVSNWEVPFFSETLGE